MHHFLHKYPPGQRRDSVAPFYESMLEEAERVAEPAAIYQEYSLSDFDSPFLERLPPGTTSVTLAVVTIGKPIEERITEVFWEDPVAGAVLDEICLALVSGMATAIHRKVREEARARSLKIGPPYRPGIGRWPLTFQSYIFSRLPADRIRVELSPEFIMSPHKSTSLIIPLIDLQPDSTSHQ
jgi:cobalamin-dependent methionine synthase I